MQAHINLYLKQISECLLRTKCEVNGLKKQVLVTGGGGFIGIHFIDYLLTNTDYEVTNIDSLTYAANVKALRIFQDESRYRFIRGDIRNNMDLTLVFDREYDVLFHIAAETDVDRSIRDARPFYETNVAGTMNLLDFVRNGMCKRFIYISTDEVYGSLTKEQRPFKESDPLAPNNPYAASKASAELFVQAYMNTYDLPAIITRCSNNYGPFQHREKLIPKVIVHALFEKEIPLYGDGQQIRDWLNVKDHCRALHFIAEKGSLGEIYNIGGGFELTNLQVVTHIFNLLNKDEQLITFVPDRLGHDRRYSLDTEKIKTLGFVPQIDFAQGIVDTIDWYKRHCKNSVVAEEKS